jgi:hypothetical protein
MIPIVASLLGTLAKKIAILEERAKHTCEKPK